MINKTSNINPNFTGFAKFTASPKNAKDLAAKIKANLPESYVFSDKRPTKKKTYYIITGKHQDKFIDLIRKKDIFFLELKQNIEKFMGEKAKKLSTRALKKDLNNHKKINI